jgi:hypothetical protein
MSGVFSSLVAAQGISIAVIIITLPRRHHLGARGVRTFRFALWHLGEMERRYETARGLKAEP